MTAATLGGILLVLGAIALFFGKVQWSVGLYFIADTMWLAMAIQANDLTGTIFVGLGMLLGLGVFIKQHFGIFHKDLKIKK